MQRDQIYPHIASHDAKHSTFALWTRGLTDAAHNFSAWRDAPLAPVRVLVNAAVRASVLVHARSACLHGTKGQHPSTLAGHCE